MTIIFFFVCLVLVFIVPIYMILSNLGFRSVEIPLIISAAISGILSYLAYKDLRKG